MSGPIEAWLNTLDADDRGLAEEALSRRACPFLAQRGACDQGCYDEPSCIADQPTEGWDAALAAMGCPIFDTSGCMKDWFSSRVCQHGTPTCVVDHEGASPRAKQGPA